MELDPRYVDVAIRRWQGFTGERAIHAESGLAFDEVARDVVADPSRSTLIMSEADHGG
jgi:hypothetical protein